MPKPLLDTLSYLAPHFAASAVLRVFQENAKYKPIAGFSAEHDAWTTQSDLREDLFKRAKLQWCQLTKKDFTYFPYSIDYVAKLYSRLCQQEPQTVKRWSAELKEALDDATH